MLRIGVTGLMASGKSSVARRFREHGALLVEGDVLGWRTLAIPAVKEALAARFGAAVLSGDGSVDRAFLGRVVFGDAEAMEALNAIVQPPLLALVREALDAPRGDGVLVVDAALLTTWRLEPELDGVVEVLAPVEARIARLSASRAFSESEARARILGQRLPPVRDARRHWRIENESGLTELEVKSDRIWREIVRLQPGLKSS